MNTTLKDLLSVGWEITLNSQYCLFLTLKRGEQITATLDYYRDTLTYVYQIFYKTDDYTKKVVGECLTLETAIDKAIAALSDII